MKYRNIPVFVPHKGCPNDCSFCNQRKITDFDDEVTAEDVRKIADEYLETIDNQSAYTEIAFFGGSFTGIEVEKQEELLSAAKEYADSEKINGIRLSTRPDYIDKEIMERLVKYGVTTVEIGVQSMNDLVLKKNRRGHDKSDVIKSVEIIRNYPVKLGLQMMLGLYGGDFQSDIQTAKEIAELEPDFVRIYPTLVIAATHLEELYKQGEYSPYSVEEAVEISAKIADMFMDRNINVIRVGLMNSENITMGKDVLAGPFHPAFGELVLNRRCLNRIIDVCQKGHIKSAEIEFNFRDSSKIIGQNRCNITDLKNKGIEVLIKRNDNIPCGSMIINGERVYF